MEEMMSKVTEALTMIWQEYSNAPVPADVPLPPTFEDEMSNEAIDWPRVEAFLQRLTDDEFVPLALGTEDIIADEIAPKYGEDDAWYSNRALDTLAQVELAKVGVDGFN
jgi:hypothetical protein